MLALSSRAVERLESYAPPRPLPKLFRLTKGGALNEAIFKGATINTPSMLAVEDCLDSLRWAESVGGLSGLIARAEANLRAVENWVDHTGWIRFLPKDPSTRSCTSICLELPDDGPEVPARIAQRLEEEGVAYDIDGYRDAPPSLRIWGGSTVETADIEALLPWLDWAHGEGFQSAAAE